MTFSPFQVYIPLKYEWPISSHAILDLFSDLYPKFYISSVGSSSAGDAIMLTVGNVLVSIMQISYPISENLLFSACQESRSWKTAKEDLRYHEAYYHVSVLATADTVSESVNLARCASVVASLLCRLSPALGILWTPSNQFIRIEHLIAHETKIIEGNLPLDQWVQFNDCPAPLQDNQNQSETEIKNMITFTKGLAPFMGRELQLLEKSCAGEKPVQILYDFASLALRQASPIQDKEILSDGEVDIHASYTNSLVFKEQPVLNLEVVRRIPPKEKRRYA